MNRFRYIVCFCLLIACLQKVCAQCPSATEAFIDTVFTTESRCQNTGTATIMASGGSAPYRYSIVSGPRLTGLQSGNIFRSLPAGTYTAAVVDICNQRVTKSFVVHGSYEIPVPSVSVTPPGCNSPASGILSISINNPGARAPFTYSLVSPSPVLRPPQLQGTFDHLTAGIYSGRVTDSCGNFQTVKTVIPPDQTGSFTFSIGAFLRKDCDLYAIPYAIQTVVAANAFPYTAVLTLPGGSTQTHLITSAAGLRDTFSINLHHTSGSADTYSIRITNACGSSYVRTGNMSVLDLHAQAIPLTVCGGQNAYMLDAFGDGTNAATAALHCKPVVYTLFNPAGVMVGTQVNNAVFSGYPAGTGYKVVRSDCCRNDTLVFDWLEQPPFKLNGYLLTPARGCKEGAVSVVLSSTQNQGTVVLASGPPQITFTDGSVYSYNYPDTLKNVNLNTAINYFGTGTYKLIAIDLCGNKDSITISIQPSDLLQADFSVRSEKGCSNTNKIIWSVHSNGFGTVLVDEISGYRNTVSQTTPVTDTLLTAAGLYHVRYRFQIYSGALFLNGMSGLSCDSKTAEIDIPPYSQPVFTTPAVAACGTNRAVSLIPDTSKGVAPYLYQMIGPVAGPLQSSPEFRGLSKGTYTFLMTDACSNSFSSNVTIDTLLFPSITVNGNACTGNTVTIGAPDLPGYVYEWQHPDGTYSSGPSVSIDAVTPADTGIYTATITTSIGGCTNKNIETFRLNPCVVLPLDLLRFEAAFQQTTVQLSWQTVHEKNTRSFIVEKSTDGKQFYALKEVAASGQSMNWYEATDPSPDEETTYYRLTLVDMDGSSSHSNVISVRYHKDMTVSLWPNPVYDLFTIEWQSVPDTETRIEIIDVKGNMVLSRRLFSSTDITKTELSAGGFSSGVYVVKIIQNDSIGFIKFIKM